MIKRLVDEIGLTENEIITYSQFMNLALYDPIVGYYMRNNQKLGREGDFYTSSGVHAVFGKAFAHFFLDIIEKENLPTVVCEFGGGDGRFAKAVLDEWEHIAPKEQPLTYIVVEMSPYHRKVQQELLFETKGFVQYSSLEQLQDDNQQMFEGIIFSNELIDAFPVHVVEKNNNDIYEVFVSYCQTEERLIEIKKVCNDKKVLDWLEQYGPLLVDGQRIEIPLYMNEWIKQISMFLNRGFLITIDYGYSKEEWAMPLRKNGSLRGYYRHQLINNPLLYPTEMDLTSHIHLDAYEDLTAEMGLQKILDIKQNRFLLMIGILKFLQENYDPNPFSEKSKQNRAIQTLINDSGISAAFHVFVHGKNLAASTSYRFLTEDPYNLK